MKRCLILISALIFISMKLSDPSFRQNQKKYERVKIAYSEKEQSVISLLQKKEIQYSSFDIFLRAFKKENLLQVFAKNKADNKFQLLKEYDFCTLSGELGPKRKQGDMQVPEGFYYIDRFNPVSSYYLSLGINYPNKSDKILGNKNNPGGDIFIHGNCVSIGCIPITDEKIKELYVLCIEAKSGGQEKIPVHIFPAIMDEKGMKNLSEQFEKQNPFWVNLKSAYDFFEQNFSLPEISVGLNGEYLIKNG